MSVEPIPAKAASTGRLAPLRFSIKTVPAADTKYEDILACWQEADRLGFDAAFVNDHPMVAHEAWTLLSALLARTERLRGGIMAQGNTHRHPALTAKMAATVDHISNGRLEFVLGAGWKLETHQAFGWELPKMRQRARQF